MGVEVATEDGEIVTRDAIFFIGSKLTARFLNPEKGDMTPYNTGLLADRLEVPRILPVPQSEEDPRELPRDIEFLHVPSTDTYTLASRIFDTELEQNLRLLGKRSGVVRDESLSIDTTFDLSVIEYMPDLLETRISEFDREFKVSLIFGDKVYLDVLPLGNPNIVRLEGNSITLHVVREGMIIEATKKGRQIKCIPTIETKNFVDRVLQNAQEFET